MMLTAGVVSALFSNTGSVRAFLTVRIPVAAFEAAFLPGVLYVLSCWYKPRELGKRIAIFPTISIVTQIAGMIVNRYGPDRYQVSSNVALWRAVILADGLATIGVALIAYLLLPDYPATTRSLTRRERELATIRLIRKGQDTGSSTSRGIERLRPGEAILAAVRDPRVHLAVLTSMLAVSAGTLGHLLCTSTIQTGYNSLRGHEMSFPVYIVAAVVINLLAWSSDILRERRWHLVATLGLALVGAAVAKMNLNEGAKILFATLFASGIWSAITQSYTFAATSIRAPAEKRAVVLAIVHALSGVATVFARNMYPRMYGSRKTVNTIMTAAYLVTAAVALVVLPACISLESYRGTRAERALEQRRRALASEIHEKETEALIDDNIDLDY
jgi:MFS transporter, ACS family, DAL5 transporter family protein